MKLEMKLRMLRIAWRLSFIAPVRRPPTKIGNQVCAVGYYKK
jgi:hypothetical protein